MQRQVCRLRRLIRGMDAEVLKETNMMKTNESVPNAKNSIKNSVVSVPQSNTSYPFPFPPFKNFKYKHHNKFSFDQPYRALGFYGCPSRANVFLMPTVNCLVNLSEQPFFVLTLKEVEVCHFERISYNLRNFDLCFIFKNYTKPVLRISAIPTSHKETIMNWLDEMNLIFS
jgi:hypothetical protein